MIKNNSKSGTLINLIIAIVLTASFVVVTRLIYSFTYGVIDDPFIETMLSGSYSGTPTDLVVYIKLPLAFLLKTLLTLAPSVNWHFLFLTGCFVVSVFLVVFRICSNVGKLFYKYLCEQKQGRWKRILHKYFCCFVCTDDANSTYWAERSAL